MRSNKEILLFAKAKRDYYCEQEQEDSSDDYDEGGYWNDIDGALIDAYNELIEFIIDRSDTQKAMRNLQEEADKKNRHWAGIFNKYNDEREYELPPVKEMSIPMNELEKRGLPNPFQNKLFYIMRWLNDEG